MADSTLVVDLDSLDASLVQETVTIDPNADPFAAPPPPPDGIHRFKIKVIKDSWEQRKTKKDQPFLMCRVQGNCVAEGEKFNNLAVFDNVNTIVFDGKSRIAGIVKAAGGQVPAQTNYQELAKLLASTLAGEPIVKIRGRWIAQEKTGEQKNGKDVYKTFATGQRAFPPKKDADGNLIPGEYSAVVTGPKSGEEVKAQFEILEYLPDVG